VGFNAKLAQIPWEIRVMGPSSYGPPDPGSGKLHVYIMSTAGSTPWPEAEWRMQLKEEKARPPCET